MGLSESQRVVNSFPVLLTKELSAMSPHIIDPKHFIAYDVSDMRLMFFRINFQLLLNMYIGSPYSRAKI